MTNQISTLCLLTANQNLWKRKILWTLIQSHSPLEKYRFQQNWFPRKRQTKRKQVSLCTWVLLVTCKGLLTPKQNGQRKRKRSKNKMKRSKNKWQTSKKKFSFAFIDVNGTSGSIHTKRHFWLRRWSLNRRFKYIYWFQFNHSQYASALSGAKLTINKF